MNDDFLIQQPTQEFDMEFQQSLLHLCEPCILQRSSFVFFIDAWPFFPPLSNRVHHINVILFFQYADPVSDLLDKWGAFRSRLFRESCVFHRGNYVKDLSRLGRDLNKVIIVDNSPASYIFHPDNAVRDCLSLFFLHV